MPTYEYVCSKCDQTFEVFQPISAAPLEICPEKQCRQKNWGKGRVKRAISGGAGLIFKGSGFYITDYRSDSYKEAAKKEASAAGGKDGAAAKTSSGEAKGSGKAEAKSSGSSAAKPAPKASSA